MAQSRMKIFLIICYPFLKKEIIAAILTKSRFKVKQQIPVRYISSSQSCCLECPVDWIESHPMPPGEAANKVPYEVSIYALGFRQYPLCASVLIFFLFSHE